MKTDTSGKPAQTPVAKEITRFIIVHGDKGGVGKSFVAQATADYLANRGEKVAIIDADTRNPDVSRMFKDSLPCIQANIRSNNGWMDVMDFVMKHVGHTIIMNTPAGIGEYMKSDMESFVSFLKDQEVSVEMELWWTMNIQHDSVNLYQEAYKNYGQYFARQRVICNLHFANGDSSHQGPFFLWNESPLRTKIEKSGGKTIYFPGLHLRVVAKIFAPDCIMPFSHAIDAAAGEAVGLLHSERWKLQEWIKNVAEQLTPAFESAPAIA